MTKKTESAAHVRDELIAARVENARLREDLETARNKTVWMYTEGNAMEDPFLLRERVFELEAENVRLMRDLETAQAFDKAKVQVEADENWRMFEKAAEQRDEAKAVLDEIRKISNSQTIGVVVQSVRIAQVFRKHDSK